MLTSGDECRGSGGHLEMKLYVYAPDVEGLITVKLLMILLFKTCRIFKFVHDRLSMQCIMMLSEVFITGMSFSHDISFALWKNHETTFCV